MNEKFHHIEWIEIISVRAAGNGEIERAMELCRRISRERTRGPTAELILYRSAEYATDLSLHIHWRADAERPKKSAFGQQVAWILSDFGIINHTLWLLQRRSPGDDDAPGLAFQTAAM
ncbi:MAG: hypothetical protein GY859_12550 [Desulfobacterales bacterium]|nr:hypothetical protein [Desulfobacterales bacterium]